MTTSAEFYPLSSDGFTVVSRQRYRPTKRPNYFLCRPPHVSTLSETISPVTQKEILTPNFTPPKPPNFTPTKPEPQLVSSSASHPRQTRQTERSRRFRAARRSTITPPVPYHSLSSATDTICTNSKITGRSLDSMPTKEKDGLLRQVLNLPKRDISKSISRQMPSFPPLDAAAKSYQPTSPVSIKSEKLSVPPPFVLGATESTTGTSTNVDKPHENEQIFGERK